MSKLFIFYENKKVGILVQTSPGYMSLAGAQDKFP